jgi:hypothetical protein
MNRISSFTPRFLSAPEYICSIHEPGDQVAVLVRNRIQHQTTQRILPAKNIASAPFQAWLQEQNFSGADIFIGMNPVKEGSRNRTKEQIREIRHAYLDLDEEGRFSSGDPHLGRRTSAKFHSRHFARKTPGRLAWGRPRYEPGGNAVTCLGFAVWRRSSSHGHLATSSFAWIHEQEVQRGFRRARAATDRRGLSHPRLPRAGR